MRDALPKKARYRSNSLSERKPLKCKRKARGAFANSYPNLIYRKILVQDKFCCSKSGIERFLLSDCSQTTVSSCDQTTRLKFFRRASY